MTHRRPPELPHTLTDCSKTHTAQVIGTVRAPAGMRHKKGTDKKGFTKIVSTVGPTGSAV
ncbi:hypothetical protein [Streptomyces sviceus]|uniref:hypothetical protein n=1 Tax=Streptomyces sviceus TaxID=285530 RepID=UPI003699EAB9